jgi:RHS repeat-associated protein
MRRNIMTAKRTLTTIKNNLPTNQFMAMFLLVTLLMPITAPIPAWAYTLNLPANTNNGFELTAPQPTLAASTLGTANNLIEKFNSFAGISGISDDKTDSNLLTGSDTIEPVSNDKSDGDNKKDSKNPAKDEKVKPEKKTKLKDSKKKPTETASKIIAPKSAAMFFSQPADRPILGETQAATVLTSYQNNVGTPNGQTEPSAPTRAAATSTRERAGIGNFGFGIPVASLPGRGLDASASISYNSRVWTNTGSGFTYNIDGNWLSPGMEMSYGYLDAYGDINQPPAYYLLTDATGTRHQLTLVASDNWSYRYESSDGEFIRVQFDYCSMCTTYARRITNLRVIHSNGVEIKYGEPNAQNRYFPKKIRDRQGNFINIEYLANDQVGKMSVITDTVGRTIEFHYDSTERLIAVTVPGFNNSTTRRQTIRFYYQYMNLNWQNRFDGTITAPTYMSVLKYVYFPESNSGYRYDYSGTYGMIYKITQLHGMQVTGNSLTDNGSVVESTYTESATTRYNYAGTDIEPPSPTLTDAPKYNKRTDDWLGRASGAAPFTQFSLTDDTTTSKTTTISPDGTISESITNKADGLLKETSVKSSSGQVMSKNIFTWENGNITYGRQNPRIQKIETVNDAGQSKTVTYQYDTYNNQTVIKENDFAATGQIGTELRRTEITYQPDPYSFYRNKNLISLPKSVKRVVNNVIVSRTDYEYDNLPLVNAPNVIQHDDAYDSFNTGTYACGGHSECPSNEYDPVYGRCTVPEIHVVDYCNVYDGSSDYRGNVTKVTNFVDPTNNNDPNASITTAKYDITGNPVEASLSCCRTKVWEYSKDTEYAYAIKETKGDVGQEVTTAVYDKNTGLMTSAKDVNNQTTTVTYDPLTLRQTRVDKPNGAWATTEYGDQTYPFYVKQTGSLDTNRSVSSWNFFDGRGASYRTRSQTSGGYLSSDVEFDSIGRPSKNYNPYTVANLNDPRPATGIKFSQITQRDGLSRPTETTLQDLTTVTASYNGTVTTATDQAGKSRRQLTDALGRIVRVDEPDLNGDLGLVASPKQPTSYEYDGNDNLNKVTQSDGTNTQIRLFKYDSLSRLTHEKQVEATATLNDVGAKVTTGGLWTGFYEYNSEGLLTKGTDARGVKTTFAYDGLNRVASVTYTGESGYVTPNVTYTYDEVHENFFNKGRLTKVQTAANAAQQTPETIQNYDYDKVGQVVNHTQSIGNQSYNITYGYNLAGQLTSEKYPSGKVFNYSVDNYGRLQTVADAQRTYLSSVSFTNQGLLSSMNLGNGTSESFGYNDRFQMTSQNLNKGSQVLQKYDYGYGKIDENTGNLDLTKNNGQLGKIESFIGTQKQATQKFSYDSIGRLSDAKEYKGTDNSLTYKEHFDFDRFGNLYRKAANNSATGQANPLTYTPIEENQIEKSTNRFTSATGTTYNEAGMVVTDNKFRSMNFAYDANGRQVKATKANTSDAWSVYDALGNRVATKVNDIWQFVIYDAFGKLVAEYGTQGEGVGGVSYVLQDWQGSVRASVNNNGFIQARFDFTAFGEEVSLGVGLRSLEQGYTGDATTKQGYGLTEKDSSGQNHTWFRKQEQRAGRWTSPDPYNGSMSLGNPQSFNRYSYVENDAMNFVDPSGLNASSGGYYTWSCWVTWTSNGDGSNFQITSVTCWNTGGGGGSSGGGSSGASSGDAVSEKNVDPNCVKALKKAKLWEKILKAEKSTKFYDVDKIQNQKAEKYFGKNKTTKGLTVGDFYDNLDVNAYAFIAGAVAGKPDGKTGIYSRGGENGLKPTVKLHELAHLAYQVGRNLDISLAKKLGLNPSAKTGLAASIALNDYFDNGCKK